MANGIARPAAGVSWATVHPPGPGLGAVGGGANGVGIGVGGGAPVETPAGDSKGLPPGPGLVDDGLPAVDVQAAATRMDIVSVAAMRRNMILPPRLVLRR
jgi:hypothetical protein